MLFGKGTVRKAAIGSLIGAGLKIEGDVTFAGGLRVEGELKGRVCGSGDPGDTLMVGESGRIEGEVLVPHCVVDGAVTGSVHAEALLELHSGARVIGDVHYAELAIHTGAVVEGALLFNSAGKDSV